MTVYYGFVREAKFGGRDITRIDDHFAADTIEEAQAEAESLYPELIRPGVIIEVRANDIFMGRAQVI